MPETEDKKPYTIDIEITLKEYEDQKLLLIDAYHNIRDAFYFVHNIIRNDEIALYDPKSYHIVIPSIDNFTRLLLEYKLPSHSIYQHCSIKNEFLECDSVANSFPMFTILMSATNKILQDKIHQKQKYTEDFIKYIIDEIKILLPGINLLSDNMRLIKYYKKCCEWLNTLKEIAGYKNVSLGHINQSPDQIIITDLTSELKTTIKNIRNKIAKNTNYGSNA
jgi:hypothetical protein